jgi:MarR family transcriptional regulator, organic hydroperoxide resistance regulator
LRLDNIRSMETREELDARSVAEEAWVRLVALFWRRRREWLAAGAAQGLTPPHAMVLMRLRDDAPPLLGELARDLHCEASYATALADRLEERGLAVRRASPRDRRAKELVLTDAGRAVQERLRAAFRTPPPALLELSEDELRTLLEIARRVTPDDGAADWLIGQR